MIAILAIFIVFPLNAFYLYSIHELMMQLRDQSRSYWEKIGRPDSFDANHGVAMLTNLYREEMTRTCRDAGIGGLLKRVRMLLPLAFTATGFWLLALAWFLEGRST